MVMEKLILHSSLPTEYILAEGVPKNFVKNSPLLGLFASVHNRTRRCPHGPFPVSTLLTSILEIQTMTYMIDVFTQTIKIDEIDFKDTTTQTTISGHEINYANLLYPTDSPINLTTIAMVAVNFTKEVVITVVNATIPPTVAGLTYLLFVDHVE
ncbi:hypothetical protein HOLleu_08339 [Holothuria leucospilota]|uniref:Uncharacterized protein n=1 Tax=Holothuria leucospilota TaxID=206669 RepID=A0A9Q1CHB9_HOLLE|nr:hypothetical protein HOLleu_08339 [Holothuria leucospilota]